MAKKEESEKKVEAVGRKVLKVKLTLIEDLLGTAPNNKDLYKEWVASNSADAEKMEEELEALPADELASRGMCVFPRTTEGAPHLWDYQLKGFFKDNCSILGRIPGTACSQIKAFKKVIDGLVYPQPRVIPLQLPAGTKVGECVRPIRVNGPKGERVSIVNSESVPAGTTLECDILLVDARLEPMVRECLDHGELRGLGQWRNSGKGRFTWAERN